MYHYILDDVYFSHFTYCFVELLEYYSSILPGVFLSSNFVYCMTSCSRHQYDGDNGLCNYVAFATEAWKIKIDFYKVEYTYIISMLSRNYHIISCLARQNKRNGLKDKRKLYFSTTKSKPNTDTKKTKLENDDIHLSSSVKIVTSFSIGSFAGVLGSLAGMGGGFIMIPLMTSRFLGISQHTAHGTSLFAVAATGIAGAMGYGLKDYVDLYAAASIATCGIVSARFGARATTKISEANLKRALGIFMICVAPLVPLKGYIAETYGSDNNFSKSHEKTILEKVVPAGMIGIGSGFLAGLFGVGGGAVVVPALTVATDMTHYQALGTSLLAMTLPAISGTFTHFQKGNVALRVAFPLALGSFVGAYAGGKLGLTIPEDKLRYGFSTLMLTLGIKTLLKI